MAIPCYFHAIPHCKSLHLIDHECHLGTPHGAREHQDRHLIAVGVSQGSSINHLRHTAQSFELIHHGAAAKLHDLADLLLNKTYLVFFFLRFIK